MNPLKRWRRGKGLSANRLALLAQVSVQVIYAAECGDRLTVHPSPDNGLDRPSQVMVDKIMTVSREKVRDVIGRLEDKSMVEVNRALALWVGLA